MANHEYDFERYDLQEEYGQLATPSDALREFGWNAGAIHSDRAWLLHEWDVWVANPHYVGAPVLHPEDWDPTMDSEPYNRPEVDTDFDDIPF